MTKEVTIRGTVYPSQKAAAEALGVTSQTISKAKAAGTLDFVGTGNCNGERRAAMSRRETVANGKRYQSRAEAARALGVSPSQMSGYMRVADPEPVTIGGQGFASMSAAARALGVTPGEIRAYMRVKNLLA